MNKLRKGDQVIVLTGRDKGKRGTITLRVQREAAPDDEWLVISVADTGIGMTPAQVSRMFEEFSQADATIAGKYGGTGLGLALYQWWLIVLAAIGLIIAVCGLVFEYHAGPEAH